MVTCGKTAEPSEMTDSRVLKEPRNTWGAIWRNLANTIKRFVETDDAASCHDYYDHSFPLHPYLAPAVPFFSEF